MQDGFGKRARSGRYRVGAIMISMSDANILYSRFARKFGKVSRAHRRFRSLPTNTTTRLPFETVQGARILSESFTTIY